MAQAAKPRARKSPTQQAKIQKDTAPKTRRKTTNKAGWLAFFDRLRGKSSKINTPELASPLRLSRKQWLLSLAVIMLVAGIYYFKNLFVVATVNGEPISRLAVISDLEKSRGKETLDNLVTETLIYQEARKHNVSVSQEEVDQEIKKAEESLAKQGATLDEYLVYRNLTPESFRDSVSINKILEKILEKDVTVTDQEVGDYIKANQETLPVASSAAEQKTQAQSELRQEKLRDKIQVYLTDLKTKANINYFLNY